MAFKKISKAEEKSADGVLFDVNNGDLVAVTEIVKKLNFKDEESMFRFMLAVLSKSATRSLIITDQNGAKIPLTPSEGLLNTQNQSQAV